MAEATARWLGLVLLAGSGGSTLLHRAVFAAARHGPAQAAEFGLALLTFTLASTGMLLLVHGAALVRSAADEDDGDGDADTRAAPRRHPAAPVAPAGRAFDTRQGVAMMQARHAATRPKQADRDWTMRPRS